MYRIVLIDDEPLILAGIASLINWEDYGCSIIGKATVATEARQMILNLQPDIVITDIRMPVLDGLQLVESCKKEGAVFAFIVLTNLEEFSLARKALSLGAVDYLVKLDLKPESLAASLEKAKKQSSLLLKNHSPAGSAPSSPGSEPFASHQKVRKYLSQTLLAKADPTEMGGRFLQPGGNVLSCCCFPCVPIIFSFRRRKTSMISG